MKRIAFALVLLATPALADKTGPAELSQDMAAGAATPKGPTIEQVREEANGIIVALRNQRDAANDQIVQLSVQVNKLAKELEAAKKAADPKPETK